MLQRDITVLIPPGNLLAVTLCLETGYNLPGKYPALCSRDENQLRPTLGTTIVSVR
jgi:hypothetical protein